MQKHILINENRGVGGFRALWLRIFIPIRWKRNSYLFNENNVSVLLFSNALGNVHIYFINHRQCCIYLQYNVHNDTRKLSWWPNIWLTLSVECQELVLHNIILRSQIMSIQSCIIKTKPLEGFPVSAIRYTCWTYLS